MAMANVMAVSSVRRCLKESGANGRSRGLGMGIARLNILMMLAAGILPVQRGARPSEPADAIREPSFPGDATRGKAIFEGKGCLGCHRVRDNGSHLGPDLSDFGSVKRTPEDVERSILEPDAEILPQNRSYRVVKRDGSAITGRLLNHDTFTVQLIDSKERLLTFQKADLREYGFVKTSPMPAYRGKLSSDELADLTAHLVSLKGITKQ